MCQTQTLPVDLVSGVEVIEVAIRMLGIYQCAHMKPSERNEMRWHDNLKNGTPMAKAVHKTPYQKVGGVHGLINTYPRLIHSNLLDLFKEMIWKVLILSRPPHTDRWSVAVPKCDPTSIFNQWVWGWSWWWMGGRSCRVVCSVYTRWTLNWVMPPLRLGFVYLIGVDRLWQTLPPELLIREFERAFARSSDCPRAAHRQSQFPRFILRKIISNVFVEV